MGSNPIFKGCVVSIADDLDDYAWREEKVRQWVRYWGGIFSPIVDDSVTHLLCTESNFRKKIAPVRAALRNKGTKVVLRDWLEDSINKKVRLGTQPYQLDEQAKQERAKKRRLEKIEKYSANADKYVDERFWHIYRDSTYFGYQVLLTRSDEETGHVREKHLLTLWESNAKPCNYQCTTLFTKSRNKSIQQCLHEAPVGFERAFGTFRGFFKKRTGIAWDERITKMGIVAPDRFRYQPPGGGRPVGLVNARHVSSSVDASGHEKNGGQHGDGPLAAAEAAKRHPKRTRIEDTANYTMRNEDDGRRLAKRSRRAEPEVAIKTKFEPGGNTGDDRSVCEQPGDESTYESGFQLSPDHGPDEYPPNHGRAGKHDRRGITADDVEPTAPHGGLEAGGGDGNGDGDGDQHAANDDTEANDEAAATATAAATTPGRARPEAKYPDMVDDYDEIDTNNSDDSDSDAKAPLSPAGVLRRRAARAAAEDVLWERGRGAGGASDSQAALVDAALATRALLRARARKRGESDDGDDDDGTDDDTDDY